MTAPNPAPGPRHDALLQLLRTAGTLWNASHRFFARWDLSPSQFNVLNLLRLHPGGCTQIELSRSLVMHRSNATGLIDRLESRGLVQRRENSRDRRAYNLVLTPAGRTLVQRILPHYHRATEAVWQDIPLPRARSLAADLAKVAARCEAVQPPDP